MNLISFSSLFAGRNIKVWNKSEPAFRLFRRDCENLEYRITDVKKPLTMRDFGTLARKVNKHNTDGKKPLQEVKFLIEDPDNPRNVLTYVFTFSDDDKGENVSDDEGDEDGEEDDESLDEDDNVEVITLTPQQLFPEYFEKLSKRKKGAKRGRPRKGESANQPPAAAAKRLRKEFGFTQPQLQIVAKDIVDDKLVSKEKAHEDSFAVEFDVSGDSGGSGEQMAISRTRSGRVSRPPAAIDEDISAKIKPKARDLDGPQVERVKRKLTIPDRYRCAVCHKIYLGDRKMKKHVKLFPNHGPSPESLYPSLAPQVHNNAGAGPLAPPPPPAPSVVSGKKMPPSSAEFPLPIMTMARTQLEELVKNLDAELVLDVVSKKMFDNFSLWQLESKKLSSMSPSLKASWGEKRCMIICKKKIRTFPRWPGQHGTLECRTNFSRKLLSLSLVLGYGLSMTSEVIS